MNYVETFITIADDCPVASAVVPEAKTEKKPIAVLHYEMLAGHPYEYTQEDVLFQTFAKHRGIPAEELQARGAAMRQEFFTKDQPCLRTSPLARKYGWGFHFDREGKVALYPLGSAQYEERAKQAPRVLKALRSSRA